MNLSYFLASVVIVLGGIAAIALVEWSYRYRDDRDDLDQFNRRDKTWRNK